VRAHPKRVMVRDSDPIVVTFNATTDYLGLTVGVKFLIFLNGLSVTIFYGPERCGAIILLTELLLAPSISALSTSITTLLLSPLLMLLYSFLR